jgi:hypothetical protein
MEKENVPSTVVTNIITEAHNDSAFKDFEHARANIHTVLETAKESVQVLSEIAQQSQHPRSFEVLAKLVDSTVAASKSLLDIQEKIRQLKNIDSPMNEKAKTINNNLFVASTAELSKLLKEIKENGE